MRRVRNFVAVLLALLVSTSNTRIGAAVERPLPQELEPYFRPPTELIEKTDGYRSPLRFQNGEHVTDLTGWRRRREEIKQTWAELLGQWPPVITEPKVTTLSRVERDGFDELTVRFKWTPNEETTGYLLLPKKVAPTLQVEGKLPAVVCVYYEPETGIGRGKSHRDFALQLTKRGFVTLSIGTTQATKDRTYALYYPSIEEATVAPLSMLGYAGANAFHVLATREEVDPQRIGIVGHSFGGKWAMFSSCLYERFAAAAWSDPGIVFDTRPSVNYWEPWYLGYHPKPWRTRGVPTDDNPARGVYPRLLKQGRDLHELHALMAPRPFFVSGGSEDSPRRWLPLNHSRRVNRLLGYQHRVGMSNRPDHAPNAQSNEIMYRFFEHFLGKP